MLTYDGISTTLRAMNAPRRATAGGTTRTPASANAGVVVGGELGRNLVVEPERHLRPGQADRRVFGKAERQQHRLLDPLVRRPCAVDLLGDAQAAAIERVDDVRNRVADGGRRVRRRQLAALLPGAVDRLLQAFH